MIIKRKLGPDGQINIPKDVRKLLHIKSGSEIVMQIKDNEIIIRNASNLDPQLEKTILFTQENKYSKSKKKNITFTEEIQNKIIADEEFKKFIESIELALNSEQIKDLDIQGEMSFKRDFEIPESKKIILSLNIKNKSKIDKLELWDQIEQIIRSEIQEQIDNLPENVKEDISKLNSNFYTNVDLN